MMSFLENFILAPHYARVERVYNFTQKHNKKDKDSSDVLMKYSPNSLILLLLSNT